MGEGRERKKRERERERENEREKCHQSGIPEAGIPNLGHGPYRKPNRLARHPHAKQWVPQQV
jgi:hypothetical protein